MDQGVELVDERREPLGHHQATGPSTPEGVAAVLIGLSVVGVDVQFARRNRDFLLGERAPPAAIRGPRLPRRLPPV